MGDVMKVKPWGMDQGEYVVIAAEDFDPSIHEKFEQEVPAPTKPRKAK